MTQTIGYIAFLVRDYDEAIVFFKERLRFDLIEDTPVGEGKRWVLVGPPGTGGTALLLARAVTPEQESSIGDQAGGRVFLFLHTDDFWGDYQEMKSRGVVFAEEPRQEAFGTVVVFLDLYGNRWDLVQLQISAGERRGQVAAGQSAPGHVPDGFREFTGDMMADRTRSPETPVDHLLTQEGYNRWAEFYDAEDNPLVAIEETRVRVLLGDVSDQAVLDLGCGTGRHAVWLAATGARVQALDFSEAMLARARAKTGAADIVFKAHDLAEPLPFPAKTFDQVVCGLVVDHIADLGHFFREMHRVCRPNGAVVVSTMHPAMMLRGVQARFRDPVTGREVRPASFAHQLSDYFLAAARAGFTFDHISEHAVDEALAGRMERARKYAGWPLLFLMRLVPGTTPSNR